LPAAIDLTGRRFGRLLVLERAGERFTAGGSKRKLWKCQCDCGNTTVATTQDLRKGDTRSCGCLHLETLAEMQYKSTHGESCTRLYRIWMAMRKRCNNPASQDYADYGGRGICVCSEWDSDYLSFREWARTNGYNDTLSIDRVNVNGDYSPENCRWVDQKMQCNNRRNNIVIDLDGVQRTIAEWADITGLKYSTIYNRYVAYHWSAQKTLTTPPRDWNHNTVA